jgi:hypothetical protein
MGYDEFDAVGLRILGEADVVECVSILHEVKLVWPTQSLEQSKRELRDRYAIVLTHTQNVAIG